MFYAAGSKALGPKPAKVFSAADAQRAIVYVPAAVIWEVMLIARAGRINLRRSARASARKKKKRVLGLLNRSAKNARAERRRLMRPARAISITSQMTAAGT